MRTLILLGTLLGCTPHPAAPRHEPPFTAPPPAPTVQATPDAAVAVAPAPAPAPATAPVREPATEITPVELAGPYPSLLASCEAAQPCGFADMDASGHEIKPATVPNCYAVINPSHDIAGHLPDSISKVGGPTEMTHKTGDAEIRLGGVSCEVPQGLRREHSMYYVFVHRTDGWWRTRKPMFEYDYNDKYCAGAMYIRWNDKPSRTIAGIAAEAGCLTCMKQGQSSTITELMLRVETTGPRPAVFPLLPVGVRYRTEMYQDASSPPTDTDCKSSKSAMALRETWPADDEVVLDGPIGASVLTSEGLTLELVAGDGTIRPGRYRFTR